MSELEILFFLACIVRVFPSLNSFNNFYLTWHNIENDCLNQSSMFHVQQLLKVMFTFCCDVISRALYSAL